MESLENRKKDHIDLALRSQTGRPDMDSRFHYEPLLSGHPQKGLSPFTFLGKEHKVPMWVSSMTGGTKMAGSINRNLARACNEFGMGMGLGSCRIILEDDTFFEDFNMRPIIGDQLPLWANLGIAQIEQLLESNTVSKASRLVEKLQADGLIIHVNPMQEWFQPEGDMLRKAPIESIRAFIDEFNYPVIVKEVGQGIGPESLRQLLQLPLQAIEFAAFGGTNFSKVELHRDENGASSPFESLSMVGEDAYSMLDYVNEIIALEAPVCKELIISGGIKNFLDGYYFIKKSKMPAVYGMASTFLKYAVGDYQVLHDFIAGEIKGLEMAEAFLTIRI